MAIIRSIMKLVRWAAMAWVVITVAIAILLLAGRVAAQENFIWIQSPETLLWDLRTRDWTNGTVLYPLTPADDGYLAHTRIYTKINNEPGYMNISINAPTNTLPAWGFQMSHPTIAAPAGGLLAIVRKNYPPDGVGPTFGTFSNNPFNGLPTSTGGVQPWSLEYNSPAHQLFGDGRVGENLNLVNVVVVWEGTGGEADNVNVDLGDVDDAYDPEQEVDQEFVADEQSTAVLNELTPPQFNQFKAGQAQQFRYTIEVEASELHEEFEDFEIYIEMEDFSVEYDGEQYQVIEEEDMDTLKSVSYGVLASILSLQTAIAFIRMIRNVLGG